MTLVKMVVGLVVATACSKPARFRESPTDLAKIAMKKYALEACPQWAAAHPDQECPASLDELAAYLPSPSSKDPWGAAYVMACGANAPDGVRGMAVVSKGPDGKQWTADDITSAQ